MHQVAIIATVFLCITTNARSNSHYDNSRSSAKNIDDINDYIDYLNDQELDEMFYSTYEQVWNKANYYLNLLNLYREAADITDKQETDVCSYTN